MLRPTILGVGQFRQVGGSIVVMIVMMIFWSLRISSMQKHPTGSGNRIQYINFQTYISANVPFCERV